VPIALVEPPYARRQVAVATFNVMGEHAPGLLAKVSAEDLVSLVGFLQDVLSDLMHRKKAA
jgi:hypothetical protein